VTVCSCGIFRRLRDGRRQFVRHYQSRSAAEPRLAECQVTSAAWSASSAATRGYAFAGMNSTDRLSNSLCTAPSMSPCAPARRGPQHVEPSHVYVVRTMIAAPSGNSLWMSIDFIDDIDTASCSPLTLQSDGAIGIVQQLLARGSFPQPASSQFRGL